MNAANNRSSRMLDSNGLQVDYILQRMTHDISAFNQRANFRQAIGELPCKNSELKLKSFGAATKA
jgi:hypothetical protein